ncbi:MAG: hypothetical protein KC800_34060 [Candidatus Eremiobacteraeota bacterium]|nr:hypothetical protein [Candidatus Eremiobacteraeota bacterium]
MSLFKQFVLVSLLSLWFCGCTQTPTAVASPSPTTAATATPAMDTPVTMEPELVGDEMVFIDPTYNYAIKFSPDYFFNANPEALSAALKAGKEALNIDYEQEVGMRFTLSLDPPGSKPMISVLAVAVERVSPLAGSLTRKQYDTVSREHIKKNAAMKLLGPSELSTINGAEFYQTVYEMRPPGDDIVLTIVAYNHYDPKNRVAYIITYSLVGDNDAADKARWEEVVKSFQVDENAGKK